MRTEADCGQTPMNLEIAGDIGIAEPTVKVHRSNMMRKMNVRFLAQLARMADQLKLLSQKT
jgi:FixJ family two-component response regulator